MFSKERHVVQHVPPCEKFYISCDYGTVNPSSSAYGDIAAKMVSGIACRNITRARKEGCSRTDEAHYTALEALVGERQIEAVVIDRLLPA